MFFFNTTNKRSNIKHMLFLQSIVCLQLQGFLFFFTVFICFRFTVYYIYNPETWKSCLSTGDCFWRTPQCSVCYNLSLVLVGRVCEFGPINYESEFYWNHLLFKIYFHFRRWVYEQINQSEKTEYSCLPGKRKKISVCLISSVATN